MRWNVTRAFGLRWKVASVARYKSGHTLLGNENNTTCLDAKIRVIGAFGMRARNFMPNFGNLRGLSFPQSVADFFGWTRPNFVLWMTRKTSSSRGILQCIECLTSLRWCTKLFQRRFGRCKRERTDNEFDCQRYVSISHKESRFRTA